VRVTTGNLPEPIAVRFYADFHIHIQAKELAQLTIRQRELLQAIIASPGTLRQVSRMSLETDLAGISGQHLSGLFDGPNTEEILECVLPCLSDEARSHWERLRDAPNDTLHEALMPVFLIFDATLRVARIEQRSPDVEPVRKAVGPILDAKDLKQ
jgi:hypothetical protein